MYALKRLPLFATAAGSSTIIIRTLTTLPLIISPKRDTLFSPWSTVQSRGIKIKSMDLEAGDIIERKGRIFQVDLREIGTGKKLEDKKISEKFRSDEAFESVSVEEKSLTFLYTEGDFVILMEPETYEQTEVHKDFFGKNVAYLKDEMNVTLHFYDGNPMSASVPPLVTCTVIKESSHMEEGQTAIPKHKGVLLDNGITMQVAMNGLPYRIWDFISFNEYIIGLRVPDFIEAGDKIVVNTADHTYRSKEG